MNNEPNFGDSNNHRAEALTAAQLAQEIVRGVQQLSGDERLILGIVGYPGAGKSTLAHALESEINSLLSAESCVVVPMDGFHYSNEKLAELNLLPLKGIPATFDSSEFISLLTRLRDKSRTIFAPKFDRSIEASIENAIEILPTHQILIVEGNYLLLDDQPWNQARELLDQVWFIDTDFDAIYPRLVERHMSGGKTAEEARVKVESTDMPNARLIEKSKANADRIVRIKLN